MIQIPSPGALPIDPYFFLVGLTFALTVVYSFTLRKAEARWCVDYRCRHAAIARRCVLTGGCEAMYDAVRADDHRGERHSSPGAAAVSGRSATVSHGTRAGPVIRHAVRAVVVSRRIFPAAGAFSRSG